MRSQSNPSSSGRFPTAIAQVSERDAPQITLFASCLAEPALVCSALGLDSPDGIIGSLNQVDCPRIGGEDEPESTPTTSVLLPTTVETVAAPETTVPLDNLPETGRSTNTGLFALAAVAFGSLLIGISRRTGSRRFSKVLQERRSGGEFSCRGRAR